MTVSEDFEGLEGVDTEGMLDIERIFAGLPVMLNLGFPRALGGPGEDTTIIGSAFAYRTKDDGTTTIILTIEPEAGELLKNLEAVFELKAIGFAGIKRRPADGG